MSVGNLYQVGGEGLTDARDPNMFVYVGDRSRGEPSILIEAGLGYGHEKLRRGLGKYGLTFADIDAVLVTHGHVDHYRGFDKIAQESDARLFVPAEDVMAVESGDTMLTAAHFYNEKAAPMKVGEVIDANFRLKIGSAMIRSRHTPSHTFGSSCIEVVQEDSTTLIMGDAAFGNYFFHKDRNPEDDMRLGKESLQSLIKDCRPDAIAIGHSMIGFRKTSTRIEEMLRQFSPIDINRMIEESPSKMYVDPWRKVSGQQFNF